jgi:SH3 domain protein
MKKIIGLFASLLLTLSLPLLAEETPENLPSGYVSDDLFVYMHSGAGNNYRILGSINSGTEVKLTGKHENDYTEIIDDKNRNAWIESKYISTTPGLRSVIAELNEKLSDIESNGGQLQTDLSQANTLVDQLNSEKTQLNTEISNLNKQLSQVSSKLKDQDTNIKKEWFYNGAIV